MQTLGAIVDELLVRLGLAHRAQAYRLHAAWPSIAGPELAARSRVVRIFGNVAVIGVVSPVWAQQLALLKPRLLAAIAREIGPGVIRELRFTALSDSGPEPAALPANSQPPAPAPEDRAYASQLAAAVEDSGLASALARLIARQRAVQRERLARGWVSCTACGRPVPPGPQPCPECAQAAERRRCRHVQALLAKTPGVTYDTAAAAVPGLSRTEYQAVKETVGAQWEAAAGRSRATDAEEVIRARELLAMLRTGKVNR